jgi:multidrug efflux pump subunit AcrA (membrane-fusion protein)
MRTKRIISFGVVAAVIGGGAFLVLQPAPPEPIATLRATKATVRSEVSAQGTVQPAKVVALNFSGQGRVTAVNVAPGDLVQAGQVLAVIDDAAAKLEAKGKRSALASLERKLAALKRSGSLDAENGASQVAQSSVQANADRSLADTAEALQGQTIETADARLASAQAQAASDEAIRVADQNRLNAAQAKLDGYITKRNDLQVVLDVAKATTATARSGRDGTRPQIEAAQAKVTTLTAAREDARRAVEKAQADLDRLRAANPDAAAAGVIYSDKAVVDAREKNNQAERDLAAAEAVAAEVQRSFDPNVDALAQAETAQATAQGKFDTADANVISQTANVETLQKNLETATEAARKSQDNVGLVIKTNAADIAKEKQSVRQSAATARQSAAAKVAADKQRRLRDLGTRPLEILNAQADVDTAKRELEQVNEKFSQFTIRAPFGGMISGVNVKVGEQSTQTSSLPGVNSTTAPPAAPLTMIDASMLSVRVGFPDVDAAKVIVGQKTAVRLDALADLDLEGTVISVEPAPIVINNVSTTYVRVSLSKRPENLRVGMSGNVRVIISETPDALVIPASALNEDQGVLRVRKAVPKKGSVLDGKPTTENTKIVDVEVKTGDRADGNVQILSGLSDGDVIVAPLVEGAA